MQGTTHRGTDNDITRTYHQPTTKQLLKDKLVSCKATFSETMKSCFQCRTTNY